MPGDPPGSEELSFAGRMSHLEALMWRLEEVDPRHRNAMSLVVGLGSPPDVRSLLRRLVTVSNRLPRLRERVVAGPLASVPPSWEAFAGFDVEEHVERVTYPACTGADGLLAAAEAAAGAPFPPDRPPWRVLIVDGPTGAGGVILRLHHSYTDGLGGLRLAMELFDLEAPAGGATTSSEPFAQGGSPPPPPVSVAWPDPAEADHGHVRALLDDLHFEARRSASLFGAVAPWAARALAGALSDPEPSARSLIDLAGELRAHLAQAACPSSPLLRARSQGTRLAAVDLPLQGLRAAARRGGGTVNDAFLSGLLGGMAMYHHKHGLAPASVRLAVPVSTRSTGTEADMRNQLYGALLPGPLKPSDPVERIRLVHEMVGHARERRIAGLVDFAAMVAASMPGVDRIVARLLRSVDVVASNVPGPPGDLFLAGAPVQRLVPIGPRGGVALNATLLSYGDTAHVGVNIDPAAASDASVLVDCLVAGFEEVLV